MDYEEILNDGEPMTYEEVMHRVVHQVENCDFLFKCPQQWDKMDETENEDVRFCGECRKEVHFVKGVKSLKELREAGKCVALWQPVERKEADEQLLNSANINNDLPPHYEILAGVMVDTSKERKTPDVKNDEQVSVFRRENENSPEKSTKPRLPKAVAIIIGLLAGLILLGVVVKFLLVRF